MKYGIQTDQELLGPPKTPAWLTTIVVLLSLWVICSNWQDQRKEPYQTVEVHR